MLHLPSTCVACGQVITSGHLAIDPNTISMPRHIRRVLNALVEAKGRFISCDRLAYAVYFDNPSGGPETAIENIHTYICKLRKIISGRGLIIETSRNEGYRLVRSATEGAH